MQIKFVSHSSRHRPGLLRKAVAVVGLLALGGLALMFSLVLLPIALVGVAYLWWKTRAVRRMMREAQARMRQMQEAAAGEPQPFRGEVYEGEVIEVEAVRVQEFDVRR